MPINSNIALGFQPTTPLQLRDPLETYGRVMGIQGAQQQMQSNALQQQLAQKQLSDYEAARLGDERIGLAATQRLAAIKQKSIEHGGPSDETEIMTAFLQHPKAEYKQLGIQMLTDLENRNTFNQGFAAFNKQPVIPARGPAPGDLGSGTFDLGQPNAPIELPNIRNEFGSVSAPVRPQTPSAAMVPTNALAPAPAPTTNALMPPTVKNELDELNKTIQYFSDPRFKDPRAKEMVAEAKARRTELQKAHVVGSNLVDGSGRVIFTGDMKKSDFEQLLANSNMSEAEKNVARRNRVAKESTHPAPINVSYGPQEKAELGARGKMLVDQYTDVSKASALAAKSIPAIDSNLAILNKADFDTGFGTETKAAGAKVLAALGVKDAEKYATDAQTFLANANSAVLQKQLEQKGPQTEADAQRITATGAQLGNTKNANQFVLSVAKAQLKRDMEQRSFYDKWFTKNKTYDGAEDAWFNGEGGKSLFDRPEIKKYVTNVVDQIPGQSRATPTSAGNSVTLPDGRVKTFPNAAAANEFKKAAGL